MRMSKLGINDVGRFSDGREFIVIDRNVVGGHCTIQYRDKTQEIVTWDRRDPVVRLLGTGKLYEHTQDFLVLVKEPERTLSTLEVGDKAQFRNQTVFTVIEKTNDATVIRRKSDGQSLTMKWAESDPFVDLMGDRDQPELADSEFLEKLGFRWHYDECMTLRDGGWEIILWGDLTTLEKKTGMSLYSAKCNVGGINVQATRILKDNPTQDDVLLLIKVLEFKTR